MVILELIHERVPRPTCQKGEASLLDGDASFKCLPYQVPYVGALPKSKEGSRCANYPILTQGVSDEK